MIRLCAWPPGVGVLCMCSLFHFPVACPCVEGCVACTSGCVAIGVSAPKFKTVYLTGAQSFSFIPKLPSRTGDVNCERFSQRRFHKRRGISLPAEQLQSSQEGHRCYKHGLVRMNRVMNSEALEIYSSRNGAQTEWLHNMYNSDT
jgi:hypothetical protein